jgi:hypothetical protein
MRLLPTKRGWKRLGIGLASLIAIALIANGFMAWRTEARLQARIAAIRAAGDSASIADLAPKPIPADKNAAAILASVKTQLYQFGHDHAVFNNGPEGENYAAIETQGVPATKEQIETVRKVLDKYPEIGKAISEASARGQYASLADFSLDPYSFVEAYIQNVQSIRSVGRFVPWRMRVLVADSHPDDAVTRGIELLKITQHFENEPLLINFLVAIAMRGIAIDALHQVLAENPLSVETHVALERILETLDDPQRLARALKTERAYGVSIAVEGGVVRPSGKFGSVWTRCLRWPMKLLYVNALDSYGYLFALADRPWFEVRDQFRPEGSLSTSGHGVMAELMAPAVLTALASNSRDLALIRALRVANALAEFRDEHNREASGLNELSLPREATIDPFSGQPLKLKHRADGWIIYSVMQNGVDDGGDFKDQKDYGLAPRKHPTQ